MGVAAFLALSVGSVEADLWMESVNRIRAQLSGYLQDPATTFLAHLHFFKMGVLITFQTSVNREFHFQNWNEEKLFSGLFCFLFFFLASRVSYTPTQSVEGKRYRNLFKFVREKVRICQLQVLLNNYFQSTSAVANGERDGEGKCTGKPRGFLHSCHWASPFLFFSQTDEKFSAQ